MDKFPLSKCFIMRVDIKALKELIPTLVISLLGLFLMSTTLYERMDRAYAQPMHYIFILNSMLCFKNNIELNYADTMSSTVKRARMHRWMPTSPLFLIDYVFDSGLKMFFISLLFGVLIGICSNYRNIFDLCFLVEPYKNLLLIGSTVISSFFTTVCSCISTFICVIVCIFMSISFKFDSDNIMLPIIASISDYICTISLNYFSENIYNLVSTVYPDLGAYKSASLLPAYPEIGYSSLCQQIFLTNCALAVIIVLILGVLYLQTRDTSKLRLFSAWSLFGSFAITMVAGHLINIFSRRNIWVGCIIPFFNGVSGSIILIYIGKVTSFLNSSEPDSDTESISINSYEDEDMASCPSGKNPNNWTTLSTLLIASSCLSIFSCFLLKFFFFNMPSVYIFLFGALLNIEVAFLYFLINIIVAGMQWLGMDPACHIVPLLNALGDLIGISVFGGAMFFIS